MLSRKDQLEAMRQGEELARIHNRRDTIRLLAALAVSAVVMVGFWAMR